ncbi:hypothetical protein [Prescottella equi]|uniref:hypothetical protein n=1 Tax=Rhodococcus hoagii TaxID=43767 RepID=UPI0019DA8C57|nr:hypothetical protein [Prescottella equi]MBM4592355.1 hypothetical protein [Prescottella equi]NKU46698.1 hypothetical protein [Prescottella equi]NKW25632.1 hypothetical protein [Prescottella equi]
MTTFPSATEGPQVRHVTVGGVEEFEEFVANGVNVHFEAMGQNAWWIGITDPKTGRSWHINCGSVNERAKGYARCEEVTR